MALHETATTIRAPKAPKKPSAPGPSSNNGDPGRTGSATALSRRNRTLLIMLYDSAARVSEITDATVADLHLAKPGVHLPDWQGGKTRNMPLMNKTVEHLRAYLDEFHPDRRKHPDKPCSASRRGGQPAPLSTDAVAAILKQAATVAASTCAALKRVHCHLIRKTRAMTSTPTAFRSHSSCRCSATNP
ncbi:MAG: tyrosine-type recombinase/integrase [Tessaracoccus sp.]